MQFWPILVQFLFSTWHLSEIYISLFATFFWDSSWPTCFPSRKSNHSWMKRFESRIQIQREFLGFALWRFFNVSNQDFQGMHEAYKPELIRAAQHFHRQHLGTFGLCPNRFTFNDQFVPFLKGGQRETLNRCNSLKWRKMNSRTNHVGFCQIPVTTGQSHRPRSDGEQQKKMEGASFIKGEHWLKLESLEIYQCPFHPMEGAAKRSHG